jgi:ketosteroid isomerase-like protein
MSSRLRALEDRLTLIDLESSYAPAFDSRDAVAWADLFTQDGIYSSRGPGGNFIQGRDNLAKFCRTHPGHQVHLLSAPQLRERNNDFVGRVHFQAVGVKTDGDVIRRRQSVGYYDVLYRRGADGWRIKHRVTTLIEVVQQVTFGYDREPAELDFVEYSDPREYRFQDVRSTR